jgi:capsular polysaccharide biosynthesis protein
VPISRALKKLAGNSGSSITGRAYRRIRRDVGIFVRGLVSPPKIVAATEMPGGRYRKVHDASPVTFNRPSVLSDAEWKVFSSTIQSEIPASRVFEFDNGYLFGEESWAFDHRGYAIGGMWDEMGGVGGMSHARHMLKFGPVTEEMRASARHLPGKTVILNNLFGDNYFHFVNQVVAKIPLFDGFFNLAEADHFVVPSRLTGFMRDWFTLAGIDLSKAVPMEPEGFSCDHIVMASNPSPFGMMQDWAIRYLKDLAPVQPSPISSERIFVTRADAVSWRRHLTNREEVADLATKLGFEMVTMDGRPIAEQAAIWREAKMILVVHGAAQCNQIFCKPGTHIIEMLPRNHVESCFSTMSQSLQLNHHIVMSTEKPLPVAMARRDVNAHLTIDVRQLEQLIQSIKTSVGGPA